MIDALDDGKRWRGRPAAAWPIGPVLGQVFRGFAGSGGTGLCIVTEICGTENGGGPGPEPPGTGRPPGVPINVNARVALTHVPFDPDAPYVDPRGSR